MSSDQRQAGFVERKVAVHQSTVTVTPSGVAQRVTRLVKTFTLEFVRTYENTLKFLKQCQKKNLPPGSFRACVRILDCQLMFSQVWQGCREVMVKKRRKEQFNQEMNMVDEPTI